MKALIALLLLSSIFSSSTSAAFQRTRQRRWEPNYNFKLPCDASNTTVIDCGDDAGPGNTSSTATASGSTSAAPGSTQPGIAADCQSYATAKAGDTCISFAAANNVALSQLYVLNPILGSNGSACSTQLWAEETYCIVAGTAANASSTANESLLDLGIQWLNN